MGGARKQNEKTSTQATCGFFASLAREEIKPTDIDSIWFLLFFGGGVISTRTAANCAWETIISAQV
jgi:hypothetical protein